MTFTSADYTWPIRPGLKPLAHQKVTTAFALKNKRCYILNEMGTMKTLSALWACDMLMLAQRIRRVLIISPISTMRAVWFNEVMLNMPHRRVGIAHGNAKIRESVLKSAAYDFVVMNHDGIKSAEAIIIDQQFDVIIVDELTAYKANSERTKCMIRIANAQYADMNRARTRDGGLWGMTGNATPNKPTEAFYQCKVVNPRNEYLPRYYGQFYDAVMFRITEYIEEPKPIAPHVVAMVMQPSIRYTRAECLDLPPTTYQDLEIELTPAQKEAYKAMKDKLMIEHERGLITAANAAVKLNKLLQISAGAVKDDEGQVIEVDCKPRLDALFELLEQTPQGKIIVFATFIATIKMLMREAAKRKVRADCIYGDVAPNKRAAIIDRFQTGDMEMIILQPQSTAHGITLVAGNTVVWFSLIPSNELYEQGNSRAIRGGQKLPTLVVRFLSTQADRHVAGILDHKGKFSSETLDIFNKQEI
jgi:SNF2 family DNA or RNA helicase